MQQSSGSKVNEMDMLAMAREIALDNLLKDFPMAFYWTNTEGDFLGCNQHELEVLGISSLEDIGELPNNIAYKAAWENSKEVLKNNRPQVIEEVHVTPDGKKVYYISVKKPLHDAEGNVMGLLGVSINITDRKKAEELQKKEKELAEKTARFMEAVSGSIAHEFATPLAIINMQMDLLAKTVLSNNLDMQKKDGRFQQIITTVKNTVKSASYIMSNLLVKMRSLINGKIDNFDFKNANIIVDIENVLTNYPFNTSERKLVKFNNANGFEYFGNKILTEHVLFNLIKNALRAIRSAGHGEISIRLENDDKWNKLIFTDTALGIDEDFLPKLFNQFETKENNGKGTGLGLSFCKLVLQSYGGEIRCESKKGEYASFILYFPLI